jgi:hypothetical protein
MKTGGLSFTEKLNDELYYKSQQPDFRRETMLSIQKRFQAAKAQWRSSMWKFLLFSALGICHTVSMGW